MINREEENKRLRSQGLKRLFLHAESLEFPLPDSDKTLKVEAPLDDALAGFLERLN